MGWRRLAAYLGHRVARMPGSVHAISAGFAFGAAVSFTPFVGFHLILGALMAWLARASVVASAIGTIVGNPWTFPLIWVWLYQFGGWMGVGTSERAAESLNFYRLFSQMMTAVLKFDMAYLSKSAWPIFGPMLAGGVPTYIIAWIVSYVLMKQMISGFRRSREARRQRRLARHDSKEVSA